MAADETSVTRYAIEDNDYRWGVRLRIASSIVEESDGEAAIGFEDRDGRSVLANTAITQIRLVVCDIEPISGEAQERYSVEVATGNGHRVYWLYLGLQDHRLRELCVQTTLEKARLYAKLQHYHHTGDYPCVGTGSYKPVGERPVVLCPEEWDDLCDEIPELTSDEESNGTEWFLIVHRGCVEAHPLKADALW